MKENPIRLVFVVTVRFAQNGITSFVMNYYRRLDPALVKADFVVLNDPPTALKEEIQARGGKIFVLDMRNRRPLTYLRKLTRLIRENGYQIVHAHGNSRTLAVEMLAAKRGGAVVRIPHSHNTTCNQKVLHILLKGLFTRTYTHAFACGKEAGEWLFPGAPFTVVQNAVDTGAFAFSEESRRKARRELGVEDEPVFIHVGSFNEQKNHRFLLEVFAAISSREGKARLLLAGDGPLMAEMKRYAEALCVEDRVCFLGAVENPAPYLCAADGFLLPSLFEGLPFTLLEAQANGLRCLVSKRITGDAAVTPLLTFLPLEAGADAWAQAALNLIKEVPASRLEDSKEACRALGTAGYDLVTAAKTLTELYEASLKLNRLMLVTHKMTGGGCERVVAQLLNRWAGEGMDCTLVTECNVPSFYPLDPRIRVIPLMDGEKMGVRDVPRAYGALRRLVAAMRPQVVLAMPEKVNVWTVLFLLGTGMPVVVSERNDPRRHPENRMKRLLRRLIYPFGAGFIFQTQQAADYFSPAIRNRGRVLPNPLDAGRLPEARFTGRERTVLAGGRLHSQKNFPLLIGAFERFYQTHPDWKLLIYGEGEERFRLLEAASHLPEGTVLLPGQTDRLPEKMAQCGMFVLSSDYEGMPNALIEAMAVGTACIATDCPAGGCRALITQGKNGILVPVSEVGALAEAMTRLGDDPALREQMGRAACEVRRTLDAGRICEEWRDYLERIAFK
jgi:glycosyltransferase involved in cell wall biosynthesis